MDTSEEKKHKPKLAATEIKLKSEIQNEKLFADSRAAKSFSSSTHHTLEYSIQRSPFDVLASVLRAKVEASFELRKKNSTKDRIE